MTKAFQLRTALLGLGFALLAGLPACAKLAPVAQDDERPSRLERAPLRIRQSMIPSMTSSSMTSSSLVRRCRAERSLRGYESGRADLQSRTEPARIRSHGPRVPIRGARTRQAGPSPGLRQLQGALDVGQRPAATPLQRMPPRRSGGSS